MKEALKLALEALGKVTTEMLALKDELAERGARPITNKHHQALWDSSFAAYTDHALPAAIAIKEALAQPEQTPEMVASMLVEDGRISFAAKILVDGTYDLYTTSPKRPWVGLTGFEQKELMAMSAREAVFATEAKLKEKNT